MAGLREELDAREVRPVLPDVEAERSYGCVRGSKRLVLRDDRFAVSSG
jgi:hypothetical protein